MKQTQIAMSFLRSMVLKDLKNKGMASLLAIMVWWFAFNHTVDTEMTDVEVRIAAAHEERAVVERRIMSARDARAIDTAFGGKVKLSIRGQNRLVNKVRDNPAAYSGTVRMDSSGEVALGMTEIYGFPPGVEVLNADPAKLLVVVEDLVTVEKRIELAYSGKPQAPYRYTSNKVSYEPATVAVRGPRSQVDRVEAVPTETLDLQNLRESISKHKLRLKAPTSADTPFVLIGPGASQEVTVTLELLDLRKKETFIVPVYFVMPPEHRVTVGALDKIGLVCSGTEEQFNELGRRIHDGKLYVMFRVPTDRPPGVPHLVGPKLDDLILPDGALPSGIEIIATDPSNPAYNVSHERVEE